VAKVNEIACGLEERIALLATAMLVSLAYLVEQQKFRLGWGIVVVYLETVFLYHGVDRLKANS